MWPHKRQANTYTCMVNDGGPSQVAKKSRDSVEECQEYIAHFAQANTPPGSWKKSQGKNGNALGASKGEFI